MKNTITHIDLVRPNILKVTATENETGKSFEQFFLLGQEEGKTEKMTITPEALDINQCSALSIFI